MIRVGVIGYGYWGPNLVRNFAECAATRIAAVSDTRPDRLAVAARRYPGIRTTADYHELLHDPDIHAIAIATPVASHFELARQALMAGKHVLAEKPLASSSRQAAELVALAAGVKRVLMVDHTFVYTAAVRKIAELVRSGEIGEVYYYDSVRINLGLFQHDVNVLWDLAVHDLSIIDFVLGRAPVAVSATGMRHVNGGQENIAYLTLFYDDHVMAHVHVNWLAPVKIRRAVIGGSRKMIVYDELEGSEKLKVYDKGISVASDPEKIAALRVSYRAGDMWAPQLDPSEALKVEVVEFAESINAGRKPLTDGEAGLRVVKVLEAATASLAERGRLIEISARGATA